MEQLVNTIRLRGTLHELPRFSHENHGKRFLTFLLEVPRLSGTVDTLPVIAPEPLVQALDPTAGSRITVTGQIRSHNIRSDGVRHLLVFVYAGFLAAEDGDPVNEVELSGFLCKEPIFRRTPLGREICDIMLAVPRAFQRADYLPCILWGSVAQEAASCHARDQILITGRLQSRTYHKLTQSGPEQRTTYEISALSASFSSADEACL